MTSATDTIQTLMSDPANADRHPTQYVKPCTRCGGSGRYSYNMMHGDMCYGCSGTGMQYVFSKAASHVNTSASRAKRPTAERVEVGETVGVEKDSEHFVQEGFSGRIDHKFAWADVVNIEMTDEWAGSSNGVDHHYLMMTLNRRTDGATFTLKVNPHQIVRRRFTNLDAIKAEAVELIPVKYRKAVMAAFNAKSDEPAVGSDHDRGVARLKGMLAD